MNDAIANPVTAADVAVIVADLYRAGHRHAPVLLLSGKTVLWTGVNGFLGRWVLRTIDELNAKLVANGQPMCTLYAVDVVPVPFELRNALKHPEAMHFIISDLKFGFGVLPKFDYVVHMAGIASPSHYVERPLETIEVAVDGSRHLLKIAEQDKARYLFFSSSEVYQTAPPEFTPTPESYIGAVPSMTRRSSYDVSKLLGETLAYIYSYKYGLHTNVVRIFNAFGKGLPEKDHRILPRIASATIAGRALQVFGKGKLDPTRTYNPVENAIAGVFRVLTLGASGRVYNIGADGPEVSVVELVELFQQATGVSVRTELAAPPVVYTTEPQRRCPDVTLAREHLDYRQPVTLRTGLRNFYSWAEKAYQGVPPEAR